MMFFHGSTSLNALAVEGLIVLELLFLVDLGSLQFGYQQIPRVGSGDTCPRVGNQFSISSVR